jgi:hypothetical protein
MEKEFVPYDEALALKELGFDEKCVSVYLTSKKLPYLMYRPYTINEQTDELLRPLYQQAFKFVLSIIEKDSKLERKFKKRYFLDFSSEGFQMDDNEIATTYESDEETLKEIIGFIKLNR